MQISLDDIIVHKPTKEFGRVDSVDSLGNISFYTNPQHGIAKQRKVATVDCVYVATNWGDAWKRLPNFGVNDVRCGNTREQSPKSQETPYTGEFAPNLAMWRYMVASAWQDALKRGDIETVCVRGEHLRPGDKFTQKYTGFLYRLLEPVKSGIAHDEREYTVWRVMSLNTPKAAVLEETIYDCAEYRIVKG